MELTHHSHQQSCNTQYTRLASFKSARQESATLLLTQRFSQSMRKNLLQSPKTFALECHPNPVRLTCDQLMWTGKYRHARQVWPHQCIDNTKAPATLLDSDVELPSLCHLGVLRPEPTSLPFGPENHQRQGRCTPLTSVLV